MIRLSFRDTVGYIGQSPHVPTGGPYTSNPDAPWNSPEMAAYTGLPQSQYFCPDCKTVNLLYNNKDETTKCPKCQARFSLKDVQEGNDFPNQALPRSTGLLNTYDGSNSMPSAHYTSEYGSGSASQAWGSGKS